MSVTVNGEHWHSVLDGTLLKLLAQTPEWVTLTNIESPSELRKKERKNYAGSQTPSIIEGKGVHRVTSTCTTQSLTKK